MCEYPVESYEARELSCDGLDNDCDGSTDEQLNAPTANLSEGVCESALKQCEGEQGWGEPKYALHSENYELEEQTCDLLDNDCDGTGRGVRLFEDVNHCGGCGLVCAYSNANAACQESRCEMTDCLPNYYDLLITIDGQSMLVSFAERRPTRSALCR